MGASKGGFDRRELELFGKMMDRQGEVLAGRNAAEFLAEALLKVRGKDGRL